MHILFLHAYEAPEWAASGAKLGLSFDVKFSSEHRDASYETDQESLLGSVFPSTTLPVLPLTEPSFVSNRGTETVKVKPGAMTCQIQLPDTQQHSFRFFLDFVSLVGRGLDYTCSHVSDCLLLSDLAGKPEGAVRNDVVSDVLCVILTPCTR